MTWGRPSHGDWAAVLVKAHDPDEALQLAADAHPERFRPTAAVPAAEPVARAVLADEPLPPQSRFEVLG